MVRARTPQGLHAKAAREQSRVSSRARTRPFKEVGDGSRSSTPPKRWHIPALAISSSPHVSRSWKAWERSSLSGGGRSPHTNPGGHQHAERERERLSRSSTLCKARRPAKSPGTPGRGVTGRLPARPSQGDRPVAGPMPTTPRLAVQKTTVIPCGGAASRALEPYRAGARSPRSSQAADR